MTDQYGFGYVYNREGNLIKKIKFAASPSGIAHFIMANDHYRTVVTDVCDILLASSMIGGFLDEVYDQKLRKEIMHSLLPIQMGEVDAIEPIDVSEVM